MSRIVRFADQVFLLLGGDECSLMLDVARQGLESYQELVGPVGPVTISLLGALQAARDASRANIVSRETPSAGKRANSVPLRVDSASPSLSAGSAALLLGVSAQLVRRHCALGRYQGAWRTPTGHWRIPKTSIPTSHRGASTP